MWDKLKQLSKGMYQAGCRMNIIVGLFLIAVLDHPNRRRRRKVHGKQGGSNILREKKKVETKLECEIYTN